VPGTRLLLEGGTTYSGQLKLDQGDGGSAQHPVFIGSYGSGPATVSGLNGAGITISNTAGIDIDGLDITGPGNGDLKSGSGIGITSSLRSSRRLAGITISYVRVRGFDYGITIGTSNTSTGFTDVSVDDSVLYDNTFAGLATFGASFRPARPHYAVQAIAVSHVTAYDNSGSTRVKGYSTGNGILLGSVDNGSVTWSTAYGNGSDDGSAEGPEGIWAYDSTDVYIAHDVSFGNKTDGYRLDGDGFGLDENTSHSVLEYDLSYDNEGAGFMLYAPANNGATSDNTVRFDISSADGADGNPQFGGITALGYEKAATIDQNTVVMRSRDQQFALVLGPDVRDVTVRNNILANLSGPVLSARGPLSRSEALLEGNDYYKPAPGPLVIWYRTSYASLPAWRAGTGQERVSGRATGLTANPRLAGPVTRLPENPALGLRLGAGFVLRPGSPAAGRGLDLARLFRVASGPVYFSGRKLDHQHPDIGAQ
jgi:hypothetical protein